MTSDELRAALMEMAEANTDDRIEAMAVLLGAGAVLFGRDVESPEAGLRLLLAICGAVDNMRADAAAERLALLPSDLSGKAS